MSADSPLSNDDVTKAGLTGSIKYGTIAAASSGVSSPALLGIAFVLTSFTLDRLSALSLPERFH